MSVLREKVQNFPELGGLQCPPHSSTRIPMNDIIISNKTYRLYIHLLLTLGNALSKILSPTVDMDTEKKQHRY